MVPGDKRLLEVTGTGEKFHLITQIMLHSCLVYLVEKHPKVCHVLQGLCMVSKLSRTIGRRETRWQRTPMKQQRWQPVLMPPGTAALAYNPST